MKKFSIIIAIAIALTVVIGCRASVAGSFTVIHSFNGTDGNVPTFIRQAPDESFYGLTLYGGTGNGNIFTMSKSGLVSSFMPLDMAQSPWPYSPKNRIFLGNDNNYYVNPSNYQVERITPSGQITPITFPTPLHRFAGLSSIMQANDGSIYSTDIYVNSRSLGDIQKLVDTRFVPLYDIGLNGLTQNTCPLFLIQGNDGNFYGVATGYPDDSLFRRRFFYLIYQLTPSGVINVIYSSIGHLGREPKWPENLVQGSDGNLYGVTTTTGEGGNEIFRVDLSGNYTTLATQSQILTTGADSILLATDGNVYGTMVNLIYKIATDGTVTTLNTFNFGVRSLIQAKDGSFYGVTPYGGESGNGTIFRYVPDVSIQALTSLSPTHASAGSGPTLISLTGSGFDSNSVVLFNNVRIPTTYISSTHLSATIPASLFPNFGLYSVVVTHAAVGSTNSNVLYFKVTELRVSSLELSKHSVKGGVGLTGTLQFAGKASMYTQSVVHLASSNPCVTVPSTVTVPDGQSSVSFPISTSGVSSNTSLQIVAFMVPHRVQATLTVTP